MALLYQAELRPSKIELVSGWAVRQPWYRGDPDAAFVSLAAYRFDDPDGEVGIETHLIRAGDGPVLQVPTTYRGQPLAGAEGRLIGTMQHSVLGKRWVYDAIGDPVYLGAVAAAALTGGREADLLVQLNGTQVSREPSARVIGSGTPGTPHPAVPALADITVTDATGATTAQFDGLRVELVRVIGVPGAHADPAGDNRVGTDGGETSTLTGTWPGQVDPQVLVVIRSA